VAADLAINYVRRCKCRICRLLTLIRAPGFGQARLDVQTLAVGVVPCFGCEDGKPNAAPVRD
jgi:hypothetical protein